MDGKRWETRDTTFPFSYPSLLILFSPSLPLSLHLVASFHSCLGGSGKDGKEVAKCCFPLRFPLQPWLNSINPEIPAERVI